MIILVEIFMVFLQICNSIVLRGTLLGWLSAISIILWIFIFIATKFTDYLD